jgi:dipeptide/tripeptide permease
VKISSRLSQLCSILFFFYLFYNFHNQFQSRLNLSSQQVSNSDVYIGSNATIRIEGNFMMAFKFEEDWIMKNLNNLFEISLVDFN